MQTAVQRGGIYNGYPPRAGCGQRGGRHAVQATFPHRRIAVPTLPDQIAVSTSPDRIAALRCVQGWPAATYSGGGQEAGFPGFQRTVSSGDTCHTSADVGTCNLAWHVFGHCSLVPRLSAVCQGQGQPSASSSHPANSRAREEIHPHACGYCRSSAYILRGILLPFHYGGQVHQMAGGCAHQVHHSPAVCGHLHCHVGGQGRQFTSALWTALHRLLGVQLINTTEYHPQNNGIVERCHGQLKAALRARLASTEWPEHLPWVLLGLRTAPKEDSAISAAELMFGTPLSLPAELIRDRQSLLQSTFWRG